MNVIWTPQPKQIEFMRRSEYEALYGGAAGGGKSDALLCEALRQVNIPHYKAAIFRKTYKQLEELIDRSADLYRAAFPGAKYNTTGHFWRFPSGAKIYFCNMQRVEDRTNYQGKRYDFIAFDELTHFTWDEYSYMFSRNRPSGPGTRCYMRATANPGGVGHGWVKERFITAAPPLTPIETKLSVAAPDGKTIELKKNRIFVPSTVFDNKALLENDPEYLASLALLPEAEKQALLYGSWDSFSGQVFTEWRNDPQHYDDGMFTHVINPFPIPGYWKIYRSFDFGFAKPFSVGWYAVSDSGVIYRIREYYGCTDTPNTGIKIEPTEIAQNIKRIEQEDPNLRGRKIIGIADPAIFDESRGESIASMMCKSPLFIFFEPGDHKRIPGKMQFHYRLKFNSEGRSMFYVFSTCVNFIRTIPSLVYDTKDVEDIDTAQEDHIYDECRYLFMAHPITPKQLPPPEKSGEDPLNQRIKPSNKYQFYML